MQGFEDIDLGVFGDVLLMCGRPKTRMHESTSGRPETRMHKPQDDLGVCSGPRSCERPLTTFTVFEPEDLTISERRSLHHAFPPGGWRNGRHDPSRTRLSPHGLDAPLYGSAGTLAVSVVSDCLPASAVAFFRDPPRRLTPAVGFLGARWSYCGALQQDRCPVTKRRPE